MLGRPLAPTHEGRLMPVHRYTRTAAVSVTLLALTLGLTGCGSSGGTSAAAASAAASPAPSTRPSGVRGGFDATQLKAITACLPAAGIAVPTFSAGARPSGAPSGGIPSGAPTGIPSGGPGGGAGGQGGPGGAAGGIFGSSAAQAALKACGITLPTGRPGASAAPTN